MLPIRHAEQKLFLVASSLLGFTALLIGALESHRLEGQLSPPALQAIRTGILYQIFHTLILAVLGSADRRILSPFVVKSGWCFLFGIPLFSGSLYLFAMTGFRFFTALTPLGGLLLLMGWLMFFWGTVTNPSG